MYHTVLYGHSGSSNRGCEAIVRSTIDLLSQNNVSADISTFNIEEDLQTNLDKCGKLIAYRGYEGKMSIRRIYNGVMKKAFHNDFPYEKFRQGDVLAAVQRAGSAVVIGGDTYCYSREVRLPSYALLKYAQKRGEACFLWSCSVDANAIDREMCEKLNQYTMIFPREQVSYQNLLHAGVPENKMLSMSDSAFVLPTEPVCLPTGFGNVFAYNPSYTLGGGANRDQIFSARVTLLKYILKHTDMKIALIPHVFKENFGDLKTCKELARELGKEERVMVIDGNYNCCQLKYIISKCRFLVAERTHASIAGYSQLVPTFVIGYSTKSEGIARDLFGTSEGAVIPSNVLTDTNSLISPIISFLDREKYMQKQMVDVMPQYINRARIAAKTLSAIIPEYLR